jgi:hypothetical protein
VRMGQRGAQAAHIAKTHSTITVSASAKSLWMSCFARRQYGQ